MSEELKITSILRGNEEDQFEKVVISGPRRSISGLAVTKDESEPRNPKFPDVPCCCTMMPFLNFLYATDLVADV
jgi:hypothetical protein